MSNSHPSNLKDRTNTDYDGIILGGGLSGGLLFYGLSKLFPQKRFALIEKGRQLGGNHTWCFHHADLPAQNHWILDLVSQSWPSYEVRFPGFNRRIDSSYYAIKSEDFSKKILSAQNNSKVFLTTSAEEFNHQSVKIMSDQKDVNVLTAPWVVDARGWPDMSRQSVAYQKFIGMDLELENPHAQDYALLKDATVAQTDGYRFFYILPWSKTELLIEDTYFSDDNVLDEQAIEKNILAEAEKRFGKVKRIIRKEIGCLPLPLFKLEMQNENLDSSLKQKNSFQENLKHFSEQDQSTRVVSTVEHDDPEFVNTHLEFKTPITLGARSLYFNPVTGYSLPQTLAAIQVFISSEPGGFEFIRKSMSKFLHAQKPNSDFFYMLNKMFFRAARPELRYIVLSRFYKLPIDTIERFYNGNLRLIDKARILIGKPPVPILAAVRAILSKPSDLQNELQAK